jgi:hypothetical protein
MEWISVEDRLPEPYETVIVAGGVGFINKSGTWRTPLGLDGTRDIQWKVTHWMPLPEPPTDNRKKIRAWSDD